MSGNGSIYLISHDTAEKNLKKAINEFYKLNYPDPTRIEMNKIEKFRTELEKYKEKYALLIKEHIQEEINKIDSDIEINIYSNDIDRVYVTYEEFKFEFTYYYSILLFNTKQEIVSSWLWKNQYSWLFL